MNTNNITGAGDIAAATADFSGLVKAGNLYTFGDGEVHFKDDINDTYIYFEAPDDGADYAKLGAYHGPAFGALNLVLQSAGGNLGVGIVPSERLDVNGSTEVTGEYKYATPKTRTLVVQSGEFEFRQPNTSPPATDDWVVYGDHDFAMPFTDTPIKEGNPVSLYAPLRLPYGADTITEIAMTIHDNTLSEISVELYGQPISATPLLRATASSPADADAGSIETHSSSTLSIAYDPSHVWWLVYKGQLNNSVLENGIYGVKITYTVGQAD